MSLNGFLLFLFLKVCTSYVVVVVVVVAIVAVVAVTSLVAHKLQ